MTRENHSKYYLFDLAEVIKKYYPNGGYLHPLSYYRYGFGLALLGFFIFHLPLSFSLHLLCFIGLSLAILNAPLINRLLFPNDMEKAINKDKQKLQQRLKSAVDEAQAQFEVQYAIKRVKVRKLQVYTLLFFWVILLCEIFFIYACVGHGRLLLEPTWVAYLIDYFSSLIDVSQLTYQPNVSSMTGTLLDIGTLKGGSVYRPAVLFMAWQLFIVAPFFCFMLIISARPIRPSTWLGSVSPLNINGCLSVIWVLMATFILSFLMPTMVILFLTIDFGIVTTMLSQQELLIPTTPHTEVRYPWLKGMQIDAWFYHRLLVFSVGFFMSYLGVLIATDWWIYFRRK